MVKREQKGVASHLLEGKFVLAVLLDSSNWVKAPLVLPQADLPWLVIALLRSMMSSIIEGQINSNELPCQKKV